MEKTILKTILCIMILFCVAGCNGGVSFDELYEINSIIVDYFDENEDQNYRYNYIDEENKRIIVGLVDISKRQKNKFKENIVNSKYIKFEKSGQQELSIEELKDIQYKIIDQAKSMEDKMIEKTLNMQKLFHSFSGCFVDEDNNKIVISLVNTNKPERELFRKLVFNYKNIDYEKMYYSFEKSEDLYINFEKRITEKDISGINFIEYLKTSGKKIYIEDNIDKTYVVDKARRRETLKQYILRPGLSLEEKLNKIVDRFKLISFLDDGGTKIYKDDHNYITVILCNTLEGNRDVYIGDISLEYEQYMCK